MVSEKNKAIITTALLGLGAAAAIVVLLLIRQNLKNREFVKRMRARAAARKNNRALLEGLDDQEEESQEVPLKRRTRAENIKIILDNIDRATSKAQQIFMERVELGNFFTNRGSFVQPESEVMIEEIEDEDVEDPVNSEESSEVKVAQMVDVD
jgi:hypothetical protein